jgi:phosphoribosylamine--glycine ligase
MLACVDARLADLPALTWKPGASACVVLAAAGYPGPYQKGQTIGGIETAQNRGALVFHAGTQLQEGALVSDGGRVLGVTALGDSFDQAFERAYAAANQIEFEGKYYRRDIGHRVRQGRS